MFICSKATFFSEPLHEVRPLLMAIISSTMEIANSATTSQDPWKRSSSLFDLVRIVCSLYKALWALSRSSRSLTSLAWPTINLSFYFLSTFNLTLAWYLCLVSLAKISFWDSSMFSTYFLLSKSQNNQNKSIQKEKKQKSLP
jgi:hypothetical protein